MVVYQIVYHDGLISIIYYDQHKNIMSRSNNNIRATLLSKHVSTHKIWVAVLAFTSRFRLFPDVTEVANTIKILKASVIDESCSI